MTLRLSPRPPRLPLPLRRLSTEEYAPVPHHPLNLPVIARVRAEGPKQAARLSMSVADYWSSRQGTAAALHELNQAWGGGFYSVPPEAALDREAADAALGGDHLVIDIQTHYVTGPTPNNRIAQEVPTLLLGLGESVAGDLFKGLDKLVEKQAESLYWLSEYLRCVYMESETAVAILTSAPAVVGDRKEYLLSNAELIGTRELIDRLGGTGRLINHSVVTPNVPGDIENMDLWSDWCNPAGWKVYTQFGASSEGPMKWDAPPWMLDDEQTGQPFLRRAMETGVRIVCVHKGLTIGTDLSWDGPSSPKDVGPAAKAFPDINFFIYHSGYEPRQGNLEEGPYSEEVSRSGSNRLIKSLKDAGIGPGGNVYAELGTTWYLLMAHPREAAHVIGKLLATFGEDNILWGTDCIWYGSPQPLIDAFRAFQIPDEYCERYGYPKLTPTAKEKILGLNAARVYGIDPEKARATASGDELAWVKAALAEYSSKGTPSRV